MGVSGYTVRSGSAFKNKKRGPKALPFVDISKWDIVPAEPRHWLVYDRIPRRQPTILSGHGEAGKSTLLLQLLCSTVLGRDWVGLLPEQGPAIYFCAEEEEDELHRRLDPILKHHSARYADLVAGGFKLMSYAGKDMVLGIVDKQGRVEATDLLRDLYHEAYALQPKLIAIDGLSDIYIGNERERGQVRQFMGLFRRLGIDSDSAVVISAHPSLEGIRSGSGISGSTQWFNSIRAQMYLKSPDEDDEDDDSQDNSDLRELQFLKNQYGRKGHSIRLQWKNGLYLPVESPGTFNALAAEQKADNLFLTLLRRFTKEGRNVSDNKSPTYAPAKFADEPEAKKAKMTSKALADAMLRLFAAGKIRVDPFGPPSRERRRIVETEEQGSVIVTPPPSPSNRPSNQVPTGFQPLPTDVCTHPPYTPPPVGRAGERLEDRGPVQPGNGDGAPKAGTVASVPFMITRAMKEQLRQCGVSDDEILKLTPQQAQEIIRQGLPASDYRGTDDH
jgi:RecA-family ATPase